MVPLTDRLAALPAFRSPDCQRSAAPATIVTAASKSRTSFGGRNSINATERYSMDFQFATYREEVEKMPSQDLCQGLCGLFATRGRG